MAESPLPPPKKVIKRCPREKNKKRKKHKASGQSKRRLQRSACATEAPASHPICLLLQHLKGKTGEKKEKEKRCFSQSPERPLPMEPPIFLGFFLRALALPALLSQSGGAPLDVRARRQARFVAIQNWGLFPEEMASRRRKFLFWVSHLGPSPPSRGAMVSYRHMQATQENHGWGGGGLYVASGVLAVQDGFMLQIGALPYL